MRNARHPPALIDEVLERYLDWRQASRDVTAAYDTWRTVDRAQRARAYADYCEALDAEERAAEEYRVLIDQISHVSRV
jgi:hypothetical protein